jgi:hypothetical protein
MHHDPGDHADEPFFAPLQTNHQQQHEEWSEELIRRFKRPGDKVVVEFTPTFLEHDGNRKAVCLGVSRQDCLAGEVEQIKDPVDAAAVKSINLRVQLLASLDPDAANAIIANYNNENANSFWLSLNEQYDKSYPLRWPHMTTEQRETTARLFDEYEATVRDYHALAAQAQQARDQNYVRLLESEMSNRETTIYVPIGEDHVATIIESFRDNDRVVALYPTRRGEPRRNPRIYG